MPSYRLFRLALVPMLPVLGYHVWQVRKTLPPLPPKSNHLVVGKSTQPKLLIIGESTAAGVGASSPKHTLAEYIHTLFGESYQVVNFGKNGLQAQNFIEFLTSSLPGSQRTFEGILLFLGANDCFRMTHPRQFSQSIKQILDFLQQHHSPKWIYLAAIPPVHLFPAFSKIARFYLKRQRDFLASELSLLPHHVPFLIYSESEFDPDDTFFAADQIHPSDLGYHYMASQAIKEIKQWKQAASSKYPLISPDKSTTNS